MNIKIPFLGRLIVSPGKWYGYPVRHQPSLPWWKLFAVKAYNTNVHSVPDFLGYNVWIYTHEDAICIFCALNMRKTDKKVPK